MSSKTKDNYEKLFKKAKLDSDGFGVIRIRLGDLYTYVKAKPVPLMKNELITGGELEEEEEESSPEAMVKEACRINLTKFLFKEIPEVTAIFNNLNIVKFGSAYVLYWNGAEASWKFDWGSPSNIALEKALGKLYRLSETRFEKIAALLEDKVEKLPIVKTKFEPHVDRQGNYGDETVHAVYTKTELKKFA